MNGPEIGIKKSIGISAGRFYWNFAGGGFDIRYWLRYRRCHWEWYFLPGRVFIWNQPIVPIGCDGAGCFIFLF